MAIDVPTKANSRTAVLFESETRTTVLCKQSQKSQKKQKQKKTTKQNKKKLKCLLVSWQFSTSYGGIAIQDSSPP